MIKAIAMDIGGVLLRTEDPSGRRALEKKYALQPGGVDTLVFNSKIATESTIGRASPEEIWQNLADMLSLSTEELEAFEQAFWQGDRLDQELVSFLQRQRPKYITAILTNAWMDARQSLAEKFHIIEGQNVDHILISSELGVAKPDERIYHILAERVQCEFTQILFVDDFIENINAAEVLGIQTIHYQQGMDLIERIQTKLDQY
jgi:putative hydrolase of the HAD superfamily